MINNLNYFELQYTNEIFKAFVDVIIPRTPRLAEEFGKVQYFGALDLYVNEYIIMSLNHYYIPIAQPTAEMLDIAATQLVYNLAYSGLESSQFAGGRTFVSLTPRNRFRALALLEQLQVNLAILPVPFQDNPEFVRSITGALNRFTLMGYYSEWYGYGSTRLETPNLRKLEYYPLSWKQVGYPGPSLGYRALRANNFK